MTKETEEYLLLNNLGNATGIRELKTFLRLDAGFTTKQINVMDIDQIVAEVIKYHSENPIVGS